MSDHNDFKQFLDYLEKTLDGIEKIMYAVRCKIRVEQELAQNATQKLKEDFSGPAESDAVSPAIRQGGPEIFPGTPKEESRSRKAAEKVRMSGGRMHGRS